MHLVNWGRFSNRVLFFECTGLILMVTLHHHLEWNYNFLKKLWLCTFWVKAFLERISGGRQDSWWSGQHHLIGRSENRKLTECQCSNRYEHSPSHLSHIASNSTYRHNSLAMLDCTPNTGQNISLLHWVRYLVKEVHTIASINNLIGNFLGSDFCFRNVELSLLFDIGAFASVPLWAVPCCLLPCILTSHFPNLFPSCPTFVLLYLEGQQRITLVKGTTLNLSKGELVARVVDDIAAPRTPSRREHHLVPHCWSVTFRSNPDFLSSRRDSYNWAGRNEDQSWDGMNTVTCLRRVTHKNTWSKSYFRSLQQVGLSLKVWGRP